MSHGSSGAQDGMSAGEDGEVCEQKQPILGRVGAIYGPDVNQFKKSAKNIENEDEDEARTGRRPRKSRIEAKSATSVPAAESSMTE